MKSLSANLLAAFALLCLTACGSNEDEPIGDTTVNAPGDNRPGPVDNNPTVGNTGDNVEGPSDGQPRPGDERPEPTPVEPRLRSSVPKDRTQ